MAIFLFMIIGYPVREEKLWAENDLEWLGLPTDVAIENAELSKLNAAPCSENYASGLVFGRTSPQPIAI